MRTAFFGAFCLLAAALAPRLQAQDRTLREYPLGEVSYVTTPADIQVADKIFKDLAQAKEYAYGQGLELSSAQLMLIAAKALLRTPYVAGTLESEALPVNASDSLPGKERLRISLTQTDCILFVETCLDIAKVASRQGFGIAREAFSYFPQLAAEILKSRYRGGVCQHYSDRIHYTTEWIRRQPESLKDLTLELGGQVYRHQIYFMSRKRSKYRQLAGNDPESFYNFQKIKEVEKNLNREPLSYIPSAKVASVQGRIQSGDIICFVSSTPGLDIDHVALAYTEGRPGFIHASSAEGKVVIDKKTIAEYVAGRKSLAGIKVIRPL